MFNIERIRTKDQEEDKLEKRSNCWKEKAATEVTLMIKTKTFILSLALAAVFFSGCGQIRESENEVFIVKIPPFADPDLTAGENHCHFYHWWHPPQNENVDVEKVCKRANLPNDGTPLEIMLHDDKTLTLNLEPNGSLTDPQPLIERLSKIYDERREARVMVDGTDIGETSIGIGIRIRKERRSRSDHSSARWSLT